MLRAIIGPSETVSHEEFLGWRVEYSLLIPPWNSESRMIHTKPAEYGCSFHFQYAAVRSLEVNFALEFGEDGAPPDVVDEVRLFSAAIFSIVEQLPSQSKT